MTMFSGHSLYCRSMIIAIAHRVRLDWIDAGWAGATMVSGSALVFPLVEAPAPILGDATA